MYHLMPFNIFGSSSIIINLHIGSRIVSYQRWFYYRDVGILCEQGEADLLAKIFYYYNKNKIPARFYYRLYVSPMTKYKFKIENINKRLNHNISTNLFENIEVYE